MKRTLWISALFSLILMLLAAGVAMAEEAADMAPYGQLPVPREIQRRVLSKGGVAQDHIEPNMGFKPCTQYDNEIGYEFQVPQPSFVTVEMRVEKTQSGPWLSFSDSLNGEILLQAPYYSGAKWPHTYRLRVYVKPGTYYARVYSNSLGRTYDLRVTAKAIFGITLAGPEPTPYVPGKKVRGVVGPTFGSSDCYKLVLDTPTRFSVTLKSTGSLVDFRIADWAFPMILEYMDVDQDNTRIYPRGRTYKGEVNLLPGTYILFVGKSYQEESPYNGLYELTLTKKGAAVTTVALEDNTVTHKFTKQLEAYISPKCFPQFDPGSVKFKPVNNSYGVVTADGLFTGKKPGSLYITVSGTVNGVPKSRKIKLVVAKNERVLRMSPDTGDGVVWSVKKMYFKGDKFCVDMWVYNKLYYRLNGISNLTAELIKPPISVIISPLSPIKTAIWYGTAGVVTLKFSKDSLWWGMMDETFDLRGDDANLFAVEVNCNYDGDTYLP